MKLRIINPAPASRTIVSASSVTTMMPLSHRTRRLPALPRPPSFRTSFIVVFETCSAGARPKNDRGQPADRRDVARRRRIGGEDDPVRLAGILDGGVEEPSATECQQQSDARLRRRRARGSRGAAAGRPSSAWRRAPCARRFRGPGAPIATGAGWRHCAQAMSSTRHDRAHDRREHDARLAADEPVGEGFHADADEVLVGVGYAAAIAARRWRSALLAQRASVASSASRPNTRSGRAFCASLIRWE